MESPASTTSTPHNRIPGGKWTGNRQEFTPKSCCTLLQPSASVHAPCANCNRPFLHLSGSAAGKWKGLSSRTPTSCRQRSTFSASAPPSRVRKDGRLRYSTSSRRPTLARIVCEGNGDDRRYSHPGKLSFRCRATKRGLERRSSSSGSTFRNTRPLERSAKAFSSQLIASSCFPRPTYTTAK